MTMTNDASRLRRLGAVIIDFTAVAILAILIMLVTGLMEDATAYVPPEPFIRVAGLIFVSYLLLNSYLLATRGQSLGKRAMNIQIVSNETNELLPFWLAILRSIGFFLIGVIFIQYWLIPVIAIFEATLIFGPSRRCLHDYLFNTRVQRVE